MPVGRLSARGGLPVGPLVEVGVDEISWRKHRRPRPGRHIAPTVRHATLANVATVVSFERLVNQTHQVLNVAAEVGAGKRQRDGLGEHEERRPAPTSHQSKSSGYLTATTARSCVEDPVRHTAA
jgi:hypothetical protein